MPSNQTQDVSEATDDLVDLYELQTYLEWAKNQALYPDRWAKPLTLQLELTSRCNLECVFCYNRSSPKGLSIPEFGADGWVRLAPRLASEADPFQVVISGGEPLLYQKQLPDIMEPFASNGAAFVLITNGWFVSKDSVKWLSQFNYYWIQVSIDSIHEAKHDELRARKGSWKRATQAARILAEAGLPVEVSGTIPPEEICLVGEYVDFAHSLGASKVVLGLTMPSGRAIDNQNRLETNPIDRDNVRSTMIQKGQEYRGVMEVAPTMSLPLQLNRYSILPASGCIVRPDGNVRIDCMAPFTSGNIEEQPFESIWREVGNHAWDAPVVRDYVNQISRDWDGANTTTLRHDKTRQITLNYVSPDVRLTPDSFPFTPEPLLALDKARDMVTNQTIHSDARNLGATELMDKLLVSQYEVAEVTPPFLSLLEGDGEPNERLRVGFKARKTRLEGQCLVATSHSQQFSFLNPTAQLVVSACKEPAYVDDIVAEMQATYSYVPGSRVKKDVISCLATLARRGLLEADGSAE